MIAQCLALFSEQGTTSALHNCFDFIVAKLKDFGISPDQAGVSGPGWPPGTRSFGRTVSKLKTECFDNVKSLDIVRTVPNFRQLVFGWDISIHLDKRNAEYIFCSASTLALAEDLWKTSVIKELSTLVQATYGIGYRRSAHLGPDLYALGMIAGIASTERDESEKIARWMREIIGERRYLKGLMRDVYPVNLLSRAHLEASVEGRTLQAWIRESDRRGALEEIDEYRALWRVPSDSIYPVALQLQAEGLLIASPK